MNSVQALFLLMLAVSGKDDSVTLVQLGSFNASAACVTASNAVKAALDKGSPTSMPFCLPATAISGLQKQMIVK